MLALNKIDLKRTKSPLPSFLTVGTLRRVLILQYNDWTRRLSDMKHNPPTTTTKSKTDETSAVMTNNQGEEEEEEDIDEQMQRMEEKIYVLREEIIELKGQIEGMWYVSLEVIHAYYIHTTSFSSSHYVSSSPMYPICSYHYVSCIPYFPLVFLVTLRPLFCHKNHLLHLGIAEVCAPNELLYWTRDLEGCTFEPMNTDTMSVEGVVDEKEDDPDLTWTSAVSTKG